MSTPEASTGGPGFICVGTQRAGTSWLHNALRQQPDYWLPPFKELNFFVPAGPRANIDQKLLTFHRVFTAQVQRGQAVPETLRWFSDLCLAPTMDLDWYRGLFSPAGPRLAGDISPSYFRLSDPQVARVAAALPHAKVLLLLRQPLDRARSQHRFMVNRGLWPATMPEAEVVARLTAPQSMAWGDYLATIQRWEAHFPGRVGVFFYDRLCTAPEAHLKAIGEFLGRPIRRTPPEATINAGGPGAPPWSTAASAVVAAAFLPKMQALAARYPEPVHRWCAELSAAMP